MLDLKQAAFWDKTYTRAELMKESRWLLIFIGVANLVLPFLNMKEGNSSEAENAMLGMGVIGAIYLCVAFISFFWVRFVAIFLWIFDLAYTNLIMGRMRTPSLFFMTIGIIFAYKMLVYKDAGETERSKKPLNPKGSV
jgi:hypothetical protein